MHTNIYTLLLLSIFILEKCKHFDNHIRHLYTKSKYLVDDESWPPFTPNKFVSLLLIRHIEKHFDKQMSASNIETAINSELSFRTNNISDIFQHGEEDEAHHKMILIIGVPGIGKTVLSKEIAYQWAVNKLLKTELVLMLFLREPNIHKIKELKDLVHYFYGFSKDTVEISSMCAEFLLQMDGVNLTIILDGLDEISNDIIDNTYIKHVLDRKALTSSRIIVTSRPAVSVEFQIKVDTHVEIFGFTEEHIKVFFRNELKENMQKKVTDYLDKNKNLSGICHIPFIISVLVCIVKEYDELPANRVEVYKRFVILTISRFLQKLEDSFHAISAFEELPVKYKTYLFQLSNYAFNTLEIKQIVFTRKDITKDFPKLAKESESWYGLGLLNAVRYIDIAESSDGVSYNFIHKSIQEFLAAFYITQLSKKEQFNFIKEFYFNKNYLNMWVMYTGLSKDSYILKHFLSDNKNKLRFWSKWFGVKTIKKKIDLQTERPYIFQCYSEVKDLTMCSLVGNINSKLDFSNCILSLSDIDTMILILDRSTMIHWIELNLSGCNIDDAGCFYLCEALSILTHEVFIDEINIDNNSFSVKSVRYLITILIRFKTQKIYATNNLITRDNAMITYFVMKYAKAKPSTNPLLITANRQERAIFCQSENITIIECLRSKQTVAALYCIDCQLNDEFIDQLSDIIMNHVKFLTFTYGIQRLGKII